MEIIVGKTSGFCQGVSYTVKKATEVLNEVNNKNERLYCLGEIVHNERIIDAFKNDGMIFVDDLSMVPNGAKVIFRAHGERKEIYDLAKEKNIEVIDLTCGKVRAIKQKVMSANNDYIIIVFGKKDHPETIGTYSFCENGYIAEKVEDLFEIKNLLKEINKNKIYVVEQTTFNEEYFDSIVDIIKNIFSDYEVDIEKTICNATHERQEETKELSKVSDCMIIIGGKNSSNTKELYNVSKEYCLNTFLIQDFSDLKEIEFDFTNQNNNGIMAGASTPQITVDEVINYLKER